jgi:NADH-quinone oxidoreductase subunit A
VLFIIFDVEMAFLLPWAIVAKNIAWPGFVAMMIFLWIIVIGLVYEWKKGALEWN